MIDGLAVTPDRGENLVNNSAILSCIVTITTNFKSVITALEAKSLSICQKFNNNSNDKKPLK